VGPAVGLRDVRTHRDPARIGVFDDRDTRPRGVALLTKGTDADRVVVSRNPAEPFWQVLTRALLNLAEGEEP